MIRMILAWGLYFLFLSLPNFGSWFNLITMIATTIAFALILGLYLPTMPENIKSDITNALKHYLPIVLISVVGFSSVFNIEQLENAKYMWEMAQYPRDLFVALVVLSVPYILLAGMKLQEKLATSKYW